MGCSNSYETYEPKVQTVKNTVNTAPSQNRTNQNKPEPKPLDYSSVDFKIPDEKLFELEPNFFKDISDVENVLYPYGEYHGQMRDGLRNGKGRITWTVESSKGDIYEGEWKDDAMHGKGLYIFSNGKRYKGDWYEGDMHGKGLMKYTNGYYQGEWVHDKREGIGTFLWTESELKDDIYAGEWKNDQKDGKGIYKHHNGHIFLSFWKENNINGEWQLLKKAETAQEEEEDDKPAPKKNNKNQTSKKKTKGGQFLDKFGVNAGTIDSDGQVRDQYGNPIGSVGSDGQVRDQFSNPIGKAESMDTKTAAARFFFFFKKI